MGGQGEGGGYFFTADLRELLLAKSGTSGWNTSHFRSMGGGGLPPFVLGLQTSDNEQKRISGLPCLTVVGLRLLGSPVTLKIKMKLKVKLMNNIDKKKT